MGVGEGGRVGGGNGVGVAVGAGEGGRMGDGNRVGAGRAVAVGARGGVGVGGVVGGISSAWTEGLAWRGVGSGVGRASLHAANAASKPKVTLTFREWEENLLRAMPIRPTTIAIAARSSARLVSAFEVSLLVVVYHVCDLLSIQKPRHIGRGS